jgi:glycosyltransferase involved in cell wall biosynthesis
VKGAAGQPSVRDLERETEWGRRPRKDYVELARLLGATVVDVEHMKHRALLPAKLIARLNMPAGQALEAVLLAGRSRPILAWSDRIGVLIALLLKLTFPFARSRRRPRFVFIAVYIGRRGWKGSLLPAVRLHTHIDMVITRRTQADTLNRRFGVPLEKLAVEPRPVDDRFWSPRRGAERQLICAVGWEARDYATLVAAVAALPVELEVAAGTIALPNSPDLRKSVLADLTRFVCGQLPNNVTVTSRSTSELRDLYARARLVVVPLHDVDFDAGSTAITEAMAMGKPVVATQTEALVGMFDHGGEGLFVPPYDVEALRAAIARLLAHPKEAQRMGRSGRARVEAHHRMDYCLQRIARYVTDDRTEPLAAAPPMEQHARF